MQKHLNRGCLGSEEMAKHLIETLLTLLIWEKQHRKYIFTNYFGWERPSSSPSDPPVTVSHVVNKIRALGATSSPSLIRDRDSTTSLGNPFQCLIDLSAKKLLQMSNRHLPWFRLRLCPFSCKTTGRDPSAAPRQ